MKVFKKILMFTLGALVASVIVPIVMEYYEPRYPMRGPVRCDGGMGKV